MVQFRQHSNLPGTSYDATDTPTIYAEDLNAIADYLETLYAFIKANSTGVGIGIGSPSALLELYQNGGTINHLLLSGENNTHVLNIAVTMNPSSGSVQCIRAVPSVQPTGDITNVFSFNTNVVIANSEYNISNAHNLYGQFQIGADYSGTIGTLYGLRILGWVTDNSEGSATVTNQYGVRVLDPTYKADNVNTAFRSDYDDDGNGELAFHAAGTAPSLFEAPVKVAQLSLGSWTTLTELSASVNDWDIGEGSLFRYSADSTGYVVTGIVAGVDGQVITLANVGSNAVTFLSENAGSSAANRLHIGTGGAEALGSGGLLTLVYDGTSSRWRAISSQN